MQLRVPVVSEDGKQLMPTKPSRARKWELQGKAVKKWSDAGLFYVQLTQPAGDKVQPIVVGVDPGKLFSGIAVQSARFTLYTAHLVLPFETVKKRMEQRRVMRRARRGRRIDRKLSFKLRAHRQCRFDNRKGHKIPPSIRANRQLELRVVAELCKVFPVAKIVYEYVKARTKPGCSFSPAQVGQKWAISELGKLAPVITQFGYETANLRKHLGLVKSKDKAAQTPESHATDGIALAASQFVNYEVFHQGKERGHEWNGSVDITPCPFFVIRRPPISRRQLHLMVPAKGGVRRKYGGTTTPFGIRKGDLVRYKDVIGYCSGYTGSSLSVSDSDWKRLGRYAASKVQLVRRSTGLIVQGE
jgi:RRXRR protein